MGTDTITEFEQQLMLVVMRLGDHAYGVAVQDEILKRTGRRRSFGVIYAGLERLNEHGFLQTRMGEPTDERGGRAKRFYRLTARGEATLAAALDAQRALARGLRLGSLRPREA